MNKSKNNLIEFANGKYYIMGAEVYFTGSVDAGEAYLGDFSYILGNYSQDITASRASTPALLRTVSTFSALACSTASPPPGWARSSTS